MYQLILRNSTKVLSYISAAHRETGVMYVTKRLATKSSIHIMSNEDCSRRSSHNPSMKSAMHKQNYHKTLWHKNL